MTKKSLNQNAKYVRELINTVEPDFIFSNKAINRFKIIENDTDNISTDKNIKLNKLKQKINSIDNCNLKINSKMEIVNRKISYNSNKILDRIITSQTFHQIYLLK